MSDTDIGGAVISDGWRVDHTVRAAAIADYRIDSLPDDLALDRITDFAAALCEAPIALVSLVEEHRQVFLSRTGLAAIETPRETSFCAHAMVGSSIFVVPDASIDPRFADNALVTGEPGIRFYAGVPLVTPEDIPLGSLCVIDTVPRAGLTPLQAQGLIVLAADVMTRLQDNRTASESEIALGQSEDRFRTLADAMPQMVWSTLPDGYHDYYNARWYEFTGMPSGSTDGEEWNGVFHPEDQERAWSVWRHSLETGNPYQIEYRLRHNSGDYRWTLGRALPMRAADGSITRWFGTCTDIHEQKLASEEREMIAQELSHRIKNIFSVISGLIAFAVRGNAGFAPLAEDLRARITALGRAHDFVRPHSAKSRPMAAQTSLLGLLDELFKPYGGRVHITGDDVEIDDRSATPISLVFHELATNATKYGALSAEPGSVTLHCTAEPDSVSLLWREAGGPSVSGVPDRTGFGSQLVEMSVVRQLGGTLTQDWQEGGLHVTVTAPRAAFSRS